MTNLNLCVLGDGLAKGDRIHPGTRGHIKLFDLVSNDRNWWFG